MCDQVSLSTMTTPSSMCVATTSLYKNLVSKMEGTTLSKIVNTGSKVLRAQTASLQSLLVLASGS